MKKLLPILFALVLLSSCGKHYQTLVKGVQRVTDNIELNPHQTGPYTVLAFRVDSLYDNSKLKKVCPVATVTYDASGAVLHGQLRCYTDSLPSLGNIPAGKLIELLLPKEK